MGARRCQRPAHLAAKLMKIRNALDLSQSQLARKVGVVTGAPRISEYENGIRVPDMITVLRFARLARVKMEMLVDDQMELILPQPKTTNTSV